MDHRFSRRSLFKATAAGAAAASFTAPSLRGSPARTRVLVVGAGAFGSWTALHLLRQGAEVRLVDAWGPGNSRSSSGGESRFIRAIYGADRLYSEMVQSAFDQFAQLEKVLETRVFHQTGALWMIRDEDTYVRDALPVLEDLGYPVESLSSAAAAARWPQVDFGDLRSVYYEPRAGVLAAREICRQVTEQFVVEGGSYEIASVVPGPSENGRLRTVRTPTGKPIEADAYVFCCGPWLGRVFPEVIGEAVLPSRQEVYYFGPPAGNTDFDIGRLPGWIDMGERLIYGFPRTFGRGLKIADDTRGERFDPSAGDRTPTAAGVERAREFLAHRFPAMAGAPLVETRVCQYENSPDGDLIVDRHPQAENCWIVGGGSGHGFKLSPAVGEFVARAVLEGAELPPAFALARLGNSDRRSTQFD